MTKCYLCDDPITEQNQSLEHILPNSIGGNIKSRSLICKFCNDNSGSTFDKEFANFGNILASKYNIKKDRKGVVQTIEAKDLLTGEKLLVEPGYKLSLADPEVHVTENLISVSHHDRKRAIEETKRLAKKIDGREIKEKDIEFEILEDNTQRQFIIDKPIEPYLLLKSVSKTVVNLFLYTTGDNSSCQPIINFLKQDIENNYCWFLDLGVSESIHSKSPYHVVIIRGEKRSKILYAYFEIFGEVGFLALLNGQYQGGDVQINYTFDPINSVEVVCEYDFSLKTSDIIQHLLVKPDSEMVKCFHH